MSPRYLTRCPKCDCPHTRVLKIRYNEKRDVIRRHRRCQGCGIRFRTEHRPEQFAGFVPARPSAE